MLILVMGAKGGLGTTSLAAALARAVSGVGLDLADGQLAAYLERKTWTLAGLAFATGARRRETIDQVVKRRVTLLWTPECNLVSDDTRSCVRAVVDRIPVVADGGIEPVPEIADLADVAIIVSADNPVAQYHERRLKRHFSDAIVVTLGEKPRSEVKEAAQELAEQIF